MVGRTQHSTALRIIQCSDFTEFCDTLKCRLANRYTCKIISSWYGADLQREKLGGPLFSSDLERQTFTTLADKEEHTKDFTELMAYNVHLKES